MKRPRIEDDYFEWMFEIVCRDRYEGNVSYRKLLIYLHDREFTWTLPKDANRAEDGLDLRYQFAYDTGCACADGYLDGPCSVLEMMIALAIKCEEIMDDPKVGDRTGQWFWKMIHNLGLGGMIDSRFDSTEVEKVVTRFLNREYESNGVGGLFRVPSYTRLVPDLRRIEIWIQMLWYLDSITFD